VVRGQFYEKYFKSSLSAVFLEFFSLTWKTLKVDLYEVELSPRKITLEFSQTARRRIKANKVCNKEMNRDVQICLCNTEVKMSDLLGDKMVSVGTTYEIQKRRKILPNRDQRFKDESFQRA
jgi:hypothetical protein